MFKKSLVIKLVTLALILTSSVFASEIQRIKLAEFPDTYGYADFTAGSIWLNLNDEPITARIIYGLYNAGDTTENRQLPDVSVFSGVLQVPEITLGEDNVIRYQKNEVVVVCGKVKKSLFSRALIISMSGNCIAESERNIVSGKRVVEVFLYLKI